MIIGRKQVPVRIVCEACGVRWNVITRSVAEPWIRLHEINAVSRPGGVLKDPDATPLWNHRVRNDALREPVQGVILHHDPVTTARNPLLDVPGRVVFGTVPVPVRRDFLNDSSSIVVGPLRDQRIDSRILRLPDHPDRIAFRVVARDDIKVLLRHAVHRRAGSIRPGCNNPKGMAAATYTDDGNVTPLTLGHYQSLATTRRTQVVRH